MAKDTIKVNMNVYDIPILVEQLKILETENKQLKERIDKAIEYIKEHIRVDDEYPDYMEMLIEERNELLEILGDKENE